ncbi:MAG TPA: bifunctional diguanylate cyclase/phosphodiesterase, partial [Catenuloplanes sp.]
LVRGSAADLSYDGPPGEAPVGASWTHTTGLHGHDEAGNVGVLRLRFRGPVSFNEPEEYKLNTFASALCTAVRNAAAYAELERIAADNAHAATHDPLTGLANRRALLDRGTELVGEPSSDGLTALLLIDLNHFKEVNDTLGHAAGDRVLCTVADRLDAAKQPGDLVARLGGDEFAVLFRSLPSPAMASHRAERLLAVLHESVRVDGMRITVEACGGIAFAAGTGGMAELLRRADVAMYQAKRGGQRLVTYVHTRDTADLGRLALGGELPRAVAEREFTVEFQPIVDLASGEVVAAEALTRWRHPDHGNLSPISFLDAVERSGTLPAFTEAVLDQSLTALGLWRDAGFDLPVAVNVSPRSLLDPRFPASVLARLEAHNLPPERLFLELTETLTISQLEVVDEVLGELRQAGVRLALDDFGTGYSSLSVLSRIPVHELKIDRAFVMAMDTSAEAAAVIRSTVDLGRSLNLVVVAEGVESEPQRLALWELGCTAGQGHLFARSMPADRLIAALRRGTDGRPGALAPILHETGAVVRLPANRRVPGRGRPDRLPHLPA